MRLLSKSTRTKYPLVALASSVLLAGSIAMPSSADADEPGAPVVVANGLNNPRQLHLTYDGVLLAAEAGKGGDNCQGEGEDAFCLGTTGSISAFFTPSTSVGAFPVRVQDGFISGAGPGGAFAVGVDGVSAQRFMGGNIWSQVAFAPPESGEVVDAQSGRLFVGRAGEEPVGVANISAFEEENDPDGKGVESNPYAVLDMGDHRLVADAAANAIFKVSNSGNISVFHVFPNITTEACTTATGNPEEGGWPGYNPTPEFPGCNFVPTSLALGPDSDIYVGGLASEQPGQGQVVRLDHATGEAKRTYTGFSGVTGVALDNEGSLYVSQLFGQQENPPTEESVGVVTRVRQDGTRSSKDVPFPAGLAIDQNRNVFVAAFSVSTEDGFPGTPEGVDTSGQIWKLKW